MPCADEDSPDIAYMRKVFTFLESQPEYFDMTRVYAEGFSQNSMFSAYIGYCFADNVRGIYQGKLHKCYAPIANVNSMHGNTIIITRELLQRAADESHTANCVSILYICRVLGHLI